MTSASTGATSPLVVNCFTPTPSNVRARTAAMPSTATPAVPIVRRSASTRRTIDVRNPLEAGSDAVPVGWRMTTRLVLSSCSENAPIPLRGSPWLVGSFELGIRCPSNASARTTETLARLEPARSLTSPKDFGYSYSRKAADPFGCAHSDHSYEDVLAYCIRSTGEQARSRTGHAARWHKARTPWRDSFLDWVGDTHRHNR